jgi:cytochrome b6-f complex iron-sulfur subunit
MTDKPVNKGAPKAKEPASGCGDRGRMTRRKVVWYSVFGFLGVCTTATLRFFFPRVLFEPKTRFRIGYPSDYGIGVNTRYQASQRIWVVRDSVALFVILARCPHLGCTPDWKESENKFKCPCHGSGFDTEGVNFEGPSPRPLDRLHVELDAVGQIVVDKSRVYGREDWKKPGAFLAV